MLDTLSPERIKYLRSGKRRRRLIRLSQILLLVLFLLSGR